jgi:hypothetical protein
MHVIEVKLKGKWFEVGPRVNVPCVELPNGYLVVKYIDGFTHYFRPMEWREYVPE